MTAKAGLRPPGPPTRVSELLLPTILCLLSRGPQSATSFSRLLHPKQQPAECSVPGTRVTSATASAPPATGQVDR